MSLLERMPAVNRKLFAEHGVGLEIRAGIHTGLVVAGEMGAGKAREQLAVGETPNIAARFQGIAEAGSVVVSEATWRLVEGFFTAGPLGPQPLKGVSRYVHDDFGRIDKTLRPTPPMEAGASDRVWTLEEITGLVEHMADGGQSR